MASPEWTIRKRRWSAANARSGIFLLFCESRANSLNILLTERAREDTSALEDARILFEKLLLDLLNLHFLMQNAPTANDINEALPRVREIQDPGQTSDYETLLALRERWPEYQNRQDALFDELKQAPDPAAGSA